jgi:hypothetical protein
MRQRTDKIPVGRANTYLAAATSLIALLAQLSSLADLALFRHVVCPEHGELVHLEEEAGFAPGLTAPASSRAQVDLAIATKSEGRADNRHDHCSLAVHRREISTESRTKTPAFEVGPTLAAAQIAEHAPCPSAEPIFRLAPKNSPPARVS